MPDITVTVHYIITAITNNGNSPETAGVTYTMSHTGTGLSSTRTDTFLVSDLTKGVGTSTDTLAQKQATMLSNFEALAAFFFQGFAQNVRNHQADQDDQYIINVGKDATITSMEHYLALEGDVVCN